MAICLCLQGGYLALKVFGLHGSRSPAGHVYVMYRNPPPLHIGCNKVDLNKRAVPSLRRVQDYFRSEMVIVRPPAQDYLSEVILSLTHPGYWFVNIYILSQHILLILQLL